MDDSANMPESFMDIQQGQRFLFFLFITVTSFAFYHFLLYPQSQWLVWSALTLMFITSGKRFAQRISVICLSGLLTAFVVFLSAFFAHSAIAMLIYIFVITFCCALSQSYFREQSWPALIINLFAILSLTLPVTLAENHLRIRFILAGTLLVAFAQFIFIYHFTRHHYRDWLLITFAQMRKLNSAIFSCFSPSYKENRYLLERRIHVAKIKLNQALYEIRQTLEIARNNVPPAEKIKFDEFPLTLAHIYDEMLGIAQLRLRVSDANTFSLCANELAAITDAIDQLFVCLGKRIADRRRSCSTEKLTTEIEQLAENYNQVLQVAAPEPLVFLLFIENLKSFSSAVHSLQLAEHLL